ncbi:NAD-dependent epimerase/dehydratase family protein [Actinoplanes derwentensis]|uniref:Nucleoside-diphosphate-sugar epimerase n=1 Tax=Actinoplanes derwentensis TaxID=113562 RepID=A0A1H1WBE5_9ACTN|nr:NAD-dependent epimerase/dehydratase family protein [Actinoplanes derwentensis]GID84106.1 reductase [Actinoplanes derwentensis]SDS94001.1 Nucleoside-diphosphate-sugar epimerase [Actinoplanes derwentensis]
MRILVLGGSGFVGRAMAELAVARGDTVTVFNRGLRSPVDGVEVRTGDRLADDGLAALATGEWDAVVDTWSAAGEVVGAAAALLKGRAGHFTYVSSRSVYLFDEDGHQPGLDEHAPLVDAADPGYAGDKLRGELATAVFDGPVLLARAGLILGPHEDIGRLPWWLHRLHRGGPTLAPGPRELPLQYIDARDLAAFVLDNAAAGRTGPFNTVSPPGHTTMGEFLDIAVEVTGGRAELRWRDPETILAAGIEPWIQLPVWLPPGPLHNFLHAGDVSRALAAGLRCRPVRETITDTWNWLPPQPPQRADRPVLGLDPELESAVTGLPGGGVGGHDVQAAVGQ